MSVCLSVCLFVRYAFGHGTSKCNEILQGIPFRPEEGRDEVGGAEGGVLGRIFQVFWKTIRKFLRFFKKSLSSIIQEQKYTKTCAFCHWTQEILGYSKKNERNRRNIYYDAYKTN